MAMWGLRTIFYSAIDAVIASSTHIVASFTPIWIWKPGLHIAQACPSEPASYSDRRQKANEGDAEIDRSLTQKGLGLMRIRVYDTGLVKRLNKRMHAE